MSKQLRNHFKNLNKGKGVTFDYIKVEDIRDLLKERFYSISKLESIEEYQLGLIQMGSIIEMVLYQYYDKKITGLENLINRARRDNLISEPDKSLLQMLQHMRNYIHLHLFYKSKDDVTRERFTGSFMIFKDLLDKLRAKFLDKEFLENPPDWAKI